MSKNEPWYFKYLRQQIKRIWQWTPARLQCKKRAQVGKNPEAFKCEQCGAEPLLKGAYEIDHIVPSESLDGFDGWDPYIMRTLGVEVTDLQLLCKPCHRTKSASENAERRKNGKTET